MTVIIKANWPAAQNIIAFTTTRLAEPGTPLKFNDDTFHITALGEELKEKLLLPHSPIWLSQTHSATVITLPHSEYKPMGDAAISQSANTICTVLTADCLPILICNRQGTEVAAIHAGWRGLAQGIIENTLAKLHSTANNLLAWLGPAISQAAFEVGPEVREAFLAHSPIHANSFIPSLRENHYHADLYGIARNNLHTLGINQIYGGGFCTYSDQRFYSYRRSAGCGNKVNMASMIYFT